VDKASKIVELRTEIGMVFQRFNLFTHMTALENVMEAPVHVRRVARGEAQGVAIQLLAKVGLRHRIHHYPEQLSGGEQQRVAIARALAMGPRVMLFDEVTSALDPELVGEVLGVMRQLVEEGMTMLIVTHEIRFGAEIADRAIFMDSGSIVEEGSSSILRNPSSERLKQFLSAVLRD
jgi:polar amino acid transport system ATP-binding protein